MNRTIKTETRPPARPAALKPKAPAGAARQKTVARPPAAPQSKPPAPARKRRGWPIMEAAVILVLIKIAAGAFFIWHRPGEAGRLAFQPPSQSLPAWPGFAPPAPMAPPPPPANDEKPEPVDYLAAALKVAGPAQAQAAPAQAATTVSALSAGAMMVVGAQSSAARIPLPPDGDDLLQPAVQMPSPTRPAAEAAPPQSTEADFEALRRIRDREQEVARRESLLANQAGALGNLEASLNQRLREAEAIKKETETMLQRNEAVLTEQQALAEQQKQEDDAQKDARLQHLVTAYSGMKAEQAGSLINSMDDDVAVAILSAMPGGKAGKVLAMVNPDKAARLTKAISEKRIDPNMLLQDEEAGGQ